MNHLVGNAGLNFFNLSPSAESTFMPAAIVLRSVPLVAMTPLITLVFAASAMTIWNCSVFAGKNCSPPWSVT